MEEIAARVAKAPVMFDWFAQIAQPGDRTDDPSTPWPEECAAPLILSPLANVSDCRFVSKSR
ncbi:MAG: hypothetical protein WCB47_15375, partial [Pseudolabrys sp.]